ncbi:MAG: D-aminoacyl-tRNA deacylase [Flavobacteriales bacterium]
MKVVIQRVLEASVMIDGVVHNQINQGFVVLLGIGQTDVEQDIYYLAQKILGLRVFSDHEGKMNYSLDDVMGEILLISQFTLFASTKKGNRPSYIDAAPPGMAIPLYEKFTEVIQASIGSRLKTGIFAADMKVSLINDGPVTIQIDSKNKA